MERINVKTASKMLQMSENAVRIQMERGLLPIGAVMPCLTGNRNIYVIYKERVEAWIKGEM